MRLGFSNYSAFGLFSPDNSTAIPSSRRCLQFTLFRFRLEPVSGVELASEPGRHSFEADSAADEELAAKAANANPLTPKLQLKPMLGMRLLVPQELDVDIGIVTERSCLSPDRTPSGWQDSRAPAGAPPRPLTLPTRGWGMEQGAVEVCAYRSAKAGVQGGRRSRVLSKVAGQSAGGRSRGRLLGRPIGNCPRR